MRFFTIAASLIAVAAAQYSAEETCDVVTTVTVTETLKHTPSAPSAYAPTAPAPYPTTGYSSAPAPVPSGTGYPSVPEASEYSAPPPAGTGYPVMPSGTASPSGTGASSAPYPEFTGAASGLKVGGVMMGAAGVAALFL
ncbi:Nn.00g091850.m01.CDS01 [Neocucurbitaria sp. VM-36]